MWANLQKTADLLIFTEEILNGKIRFLCSVHFDALLDTFTEFFLAGREVWKKFRIKFSSGKNAKWEPGEEWLKIPKKMFRCFVPYEHGL